MLLMGTSQPHLNSALAKSRYIARTPTLNFPGEAHMAGSMFLLHSTKEVHGFLFTFFIPFIKCLCSLDIHKSRTFFFYLFVFLHHGFQNQSNMEKT